MYFNCPISTGPELGVNLWGEGGELSSNFKYQQRIDFRWFFFSYNCVVVAEKKGSSFDLGILIDN